MLLLFPLRNFFSVDSDGIDLLNEPKSSDVYQENWENVVLLFPIVSAIDPVFLEKRKKKQLRFRTSSSCVSFYRLVLGFFSYTI